MTAEERTQLIEVLTPHFGDRSDFMASAIQRAEDGVLPSMIGQSIERWIIEFGITGANKTFLEGFYTKLDYTPGELGAMELS